MEQLGEPKVSCALKTSFQVFDPKCGGLNDRKEPLEKNFPQVFARTNLNWLLWL